MIGGYRAKIQAEIDKVKAKISEQQARLKELEQKKLEAENSEIVDIVRGMSIPLAELPLLYACDKYESSKSGTAIRNGDETQEDNDTSVQSQRPLTGESSNKGGSVRTTEG